jgi:hypothetical protein
MSQSEDEIRKELATYGIKAEFPIVIFDVDKEGPLS